MAEMHAKPRSAETAPATPGGVLPPLAALAEGRGLAALAERLGEARRGAPAARMLYGNAASIFAGDWLLVEALRRVRRAAVPGLLGRLLDVIEEMIFAESEQLEARGRFVPDRAAYMRVVEG